MFSFLDQRWLGNTIMDYFWFLVIITVGFLLKGQLCRLITSVVYLVIRKYSKKVGKQKLIQLLKDPLGLFLSAVVLYIAFDRLVIPAEWHFARKEEFGFRFMLYRIFHLGLIFSSFWIILRMIDYVTMIFLERAKSTSNLSDDQMVLFGKEAVKVGVAAIGFFILIGVAFELNVVSLITGLGIGGLAIALAAKDTLENLLASFLIFMDKPFIVGDSVKVGNIEGTVETVGFRSTRIRSIEKMMVTVPNKKMVDAELINDTNRAVRRSAQSLLFSHETTDVQIKHIVMSIRELLANNAMIERTGSIVRFRNFFDKGLEVFVVYIVLTSDVHEFLGVQEEVNFSIMKIIQEQNALLAQPQSR